MVSGSAGTDSNRTIVKVIMIMTTMKMLGAKAVATRSLIYSVSVSASVGLCLVTAVAMDRQPPRC